MVKPIIKSILAIFIGFLTVVVLSIGTDFILETTGVFPPQSQPQAYTVVMLFFALMYRSAFTVLGGYVTARVAPGKPMKHAIILGIIGIFAGTLGAIANWNLSANAHWYPVMIVVLSLPCTWLGGKLTVRT